MHPRVRVQVRVRVGCGCERVCGCGREGGCDRGREFGHSLGLSHSKQYRALMAPFYRGYQTNIALHEDDVVAVQALYGTKQTTVLAPRFGDTPKETKPPDEDLCKNSTIDSIITMEDGTYAFKGNMFWKLTEDSVMPGYPKNITRFWKGLPGKIDASFTWTNGKSFFFKDKKYWRKSLPTSLNV